MAPKAHILKLIFLGSLACSLPSAGQAAPTASRIPTKNMDAPPPQVEASDAPNNVANNEYKRPQIRCTGGKDDAASCVGQKDAFGRAAQGYSYLAHYMQTQSLFAESVTNKPEKLKEMQESVVACLQGAPSCGPKEKSRMMQALIQYNLGKGVKSMILQSNTNQLNLKSVGDGKIFSGKKQLARQTGYSYTDSFKLTGRDLAEGVTYQIDAKTAAQRDKLGEDFKEKYEKFIDLYSSTTDEKMKWNYAHGAPANGDSSASADGSGRGVKHMVWELDPETKSPKLKKERFTWDEFSQNQEVVKKQVAAYKENLRNPNFEAQEPEKDGKKPAKPGQPMSIAVKSDLREDLKFRAVGLGMPDIGVMPNTNEITTDQEKIAAGIAASINEKIDHASKRNLASAGPEKKTVPSVQIDINEFDKYLDKIWPDTGYKYKIPSQNK